MPMETWMNALNLGENFSIDEVLILWKGRLLFRVYIKTKRFSFWIKLYSLQTSEYTAWSCSRTHTGNFYVNIHKDRYNMSENPDLKKFTIVIFIARNMKDQSQHIVLDNWYISVRLAELFLKHDTTITGEMHPIRVVLKEVIQSSLQVYQSVFMRDGKMPLVKYDEKRDVYILTTQCTIGFAKKSKRLSGIKQEYFKKPDYV